MPLQQHVYMQDDLWSGSSQLAEVLLISCTSATPMTTQGNAIYLMPLLEKLHHGTFAVLLLTACTQLVPAAQVMLGNLLNSINITVSLSS